jgi:hypothetical protein
VACGADGDDFDGDADVVFEAGDVMFGLGGELVEGGDVIEGVMPACDGFVAGGGLGEFKGVGGEPVSRRAIDCVVGADVELVEGGEDIEEHEGGAGGAGDGDGVAEGDGVDPSAAAGASGGGAVFVAACADFFADGVVEFGGEGAGADAGGVGLDDAEGGVDGFGGEASADGESGAAVGGGDVGDGAVVDVEEDGVGAFEEEAFFVFDGLVEEFGGVGDEGAELFAAGAVLLEHGVPVEGVSVVEGFEDGVFFGDDALKFFGEAGIVEEVGKADGGGAVGFVGVAGSDAAAGGADLGAGGFGFGELVLKFVVGEDDVGVGGEFEVGFDADALGGEAIDFFEGFEGVDDDTVADDAGDVGAEDADGDEVEAVLDDAGAGFDFDFVTGVGAAVPSDGEVEVAGEEVDDFALAFIAPLEADDGDVSERAERCRGGGERGGDGRHGGARLLNFG